jgi:hypothetical protein
MRNRRILLVLVSLLFAPLASAASYGTEAQPELVDVTGDVSYHDMHVGAQDHDWLDLMSAWFEYDNATDTLVTTIKVQDAEALSSPPSDWLIYCYVRGDVVADDEVKGQLTFRYVQPSGQQEHESRVEFESDPGKTVQGFDANEQLRHEYELKATAPGYHVFRTDRALMQQLADRIEGLEAWCLDEYMPAANFGVYANGDNVESQAEYSFTELRPVRAPDGTELPPDVEPEGTNASESPEPGSSSPAATVPLLLACVALGLGLAAVRARTPRGR